LLAREKRAGKITWQFQRVLKSARKELKPTGQEHEKIVKIAVDRPGGRIMRLRRLSKAPSKPPMSLA